jgi:hypothetical protein
MPEPPSPTFPPDDEPEDDPEDEPEDDPEDEPEDDPEDEPEDEPEDDPEDEPEDDPEDELEPPSGVFWVEAPQAQSATRAARPGAPTRQQRATNGTSDRPRNGMNRALANLTVPGPRFAATEETVVPRCKRFRTRRNTYLLRRNGRCFECSRETPSVPAGTDGACSRTATRFLGFEPGGKQEWKLDISPPTADPLAG